jgi:hypothetical protein
VFAQTFASIIILSFLHFLAYLVIFSFFYQRGEAKLLSEDWEGAVQDLKEAAQKSPQDMGIREALMRAEKQLKLSKRKDWYKILGISKTASAAEIKRAYKKLALQWHPDKNVDNREEAENMFREIAAAYEVLGDEDKRVRFQVGSGPWGLRRKLWASLDLKWQERREAGFTEQRRPLSPMAGRGRLGKPRRWSTWGNRVGRPVGKSAGHQA